MANHKSAEKRHRQQERRTARARAVKKRVRSVLRDARAAVVAGDDNAEALVRKATSLLDRAVSKNVFHRKRVARIKSRLSKLSRAEPS